MMSTGCISSISCGQDNRQSQLCTSVQRKIDDIESFLYDRMDDFTKKENNIKLDEKEKSKIRSIVAELSLMDFNDETKYERVNKSINITTELLYIFYIIFIYLFVLILFDSFIELFLSNIYISIINYYVVKEVIFTIMEKFRYEKKIISHKDKFNNAMLILRRKYKLVPKKNQLNYYYLQMRREGIISRNEALENCFIMKSMRSESGVMVISVIMPPDDFSCAFDCHYCPNVPGLSRSYYPGEPTVERGSRNGFSGFKQFRERGHVYLFNGHPVDKFEVIILGGTFSSYQPKIAENFICDLYYAANTMMDSLDDIRPKMSLEEEIKINEDALCKIIGLTIETRPDVITRYELRRFRRYGVTRIQMGVQHTDDTVLDLLNRQCNQEKIIQAIELTKCEGFKIDIHIMPDLPGSSLEKDKKMIETILFDPRYRTHGLKIYPHNVMKETEVYKWYIDGRYKPYAESDPEGFVNLIVWTMKNIPPYIRVNRVQRDFPGQYILGGNKCTNLRQVIDDIMKRDDIHSKDIRTMEIKGKEFDMNNIRIVRYDSPTNKGIEVFLGLYSCGCKPFKNITQYFPQFDNANFCPKIIKRMIYKRITGKESLYDGCGHENNIHGFLRLHMTHNAGKEAFPVLHNKGLILEFHIYGKVQTTYTQHTPSKSQHKGFGSILIENAENIVKQEGYLYGGLDGMAVIAGVGVRNYYRKKGYEIPTEENHHGDFLIKKF